jgi:hypothetical protein
MFQVKAASVSWPSRSSTGDRSRKAFREFSLSLDRFNILVGPNDAGKSTIVGAFRILAEGLRRERFCCPQNHRPSASVETPRGARAGPELARPQGLKESIMGWAAFNIASE